MKLTWTMDAEHGVLRLAGEITEEADFAPMIKVARSSGIAVDLGEVSEINSCGVREWIHFMRDLDGGPPIELVRCSPAMVRQLNMIANFAGPASVSSVMLPYYCEACGHEEDRVLELADAGEPEIPLESECPACGDVLEFDDLPGSYLGFVRTSALRGAA